MQPDKRKFLIAFYGFLDSDDHDKCYFKLVNGHEYQGWIFGINENTFEFKDSGPLAKADSLMLLINELDTSSFAYWHEGKKKWLEYKG